MLPGWGKRLWVRGAGSPRWRGAGRWQPSPELFAPGVCGVQPAARDSATRVRSGAIEAERGARSCAQGMPSLGAISPNLWAQPVPRPQAPQEGSSLRGTREGAALEVLRGPSRQRGTQGASGRKRQARGPPAAPVCAQRWGPHHEWKRWPLWTARDFGRSFASRGYFS